MNEQQQPIERLLQIMKQLRDPVTGCPWDIKQDFDTISGYTIEEAYEVADAIRQNDPEQICDELGDLLLQVVFHAQIAQDKNLFNFNDVATVICDKMERRHPHIFSDVTAETEQDVRQNWEQIKTQERAARQRDKGDGLPSLLDDIPRNMPALKTAVKLQKRAASVGFDWPNLDEVLDKLREETDELEEALHAKDPSCIKEELGDLLFVVANLARKAGIETETALLDANAKFERRFRYIEAQLHQQQKSLDDSTLAEMDSYWNDAKRAEKTG